jgi:hypothetical protein
MVACRSEGSPTPHRPRIGTGSLDRGATSGNP